MNDIPGIVTIAPRNAKMCIKIKIMHTFCKHKSCVNFHNQSLQLIWKTTEGNLKRKSV